MARIAKLSSQWLFRKANSCSADERSALHEVAAQLSSERKAVVDWLEEVKRSAKTVEPGEAARQLELDLKEIREYQGEISARHRAIQRQLSAISCKRAALREIAKRLQEVEVHEHDKRIKGGEALSRMKSDPRELVQRLLAEGLVESAEMIGTFGQPSGKVSTVRADGSALVAEPRARTITCCECGASFDKPLSCMAIYCSACEKKNYARHTRLVQSLRRVAGVIPLAPKSAWPTFVSGRPLQGGAPS